jgi:hypothetical protein
MKLKYLILILFIISIFAGNLYALKILEPLSKDITNNDTVDLGFFSAGEFFMISFLLENNENYNQITVAKNQIKDVIIEPTKKTQESIFTIIKLDENLKGQYTLKLLLTSEQETKEVRLNMFITDNVIYSNLINYNPVITYNQKETIILNLINKSNTTKKVIIKSDLPTTWFINKRNKLNNSFEIILLPNAISEKLYEYYPKEIGPKEINLQIKSVSNEKIIQNIINYKLNIVVKKDLNSIYGSKKHTFPLFNVNLIPIYFLNKIIKMI